MCLRLDGVYRCDYRCDVCDFGNTTVSRCGKSVLNKESEAPFFCAFMDVVGATRQFNRCEEDNDGHWITGIEKYAFISKFTSCTILEI